MAESDTPHQPPLLLPDEARQGADPATAPLRLETTQSREALLDGAWWPRSHNIVAELPALITELTSRLGPITRVGLDSAAWEELPTRLIIDDRVVHLDAHEVGDGTAGIRPDTVFMPFHWPGAGRANNLTNPALDP
ncbi:DUF5994 family protein, partial [Streptomyces sp. NPDC056512]|uniref:DUF5994 family protein n=1 Tax=Streptomyces sp. NPDC056512 TaxID=3345846 RepID=UPI00369FE4E8